HRRSAAPKAARRIVSSDRADQRAAAEPAAAEPAAVKHAGPERGDTGGLAGERHTRCAHGDGGHLCNSTPVATKINTPLIDIPQSLSVVTREFINDNSFQNLTDITRYVPGVDIHQGEGNRDELIIRGVDSAPTSTSTASATTCNIFAISTTRRASRC